MRGPGRGPAGPLGRIVHFMHLSLVQMDEHALHELAREQQDLVAVWQLKLAGWSDGKLRHWIARRSWRRVHDGVYAMFHAPLSRSQRWMAATLTAPATALSHASGGACWEMRAYEGPFEIVTRNGNGGPRRHGELLICRLPLSPDDVTTHRGIRVTTGARTLLDLAPYLAEEQLARAFREALRIHVTTPAELTATLARGRGRRGAGRLAKLTARYADLQYPRARSNAEARALELLADDGNLPDQVNERIAGEEADLIWTERRLIVEIDGPAFHRFADEDARKQRAWEGAGFAVRRVPSDDVYNRPGQLVAAARA